LSADSAANTSNLCAEVREKLIGFLQREHPEALPRRRTEFMETPARSSSEPAAASPRLPGDRGQSQPS
jgi:hypothetical protein